MKSLMFIFSFIMILISCSDGNSREPNSDEEDNKGEINPPEEKFVKVTWDEESYNVHHVGIEGFTMNSNRDSFRIRIVSEENPSIYLYGFKKDGVYNGNYTFDEERKPTTFYGVVYTRGDFGQPSGTLSGNLEIKDSDEEEVDISFELTTVYKVKIKGQIKGKYGLVADLPSYEDELYNDIKTFSFNDQKVQLQSHTGSDIPDVQNGDKFSSKLVFTDNSVIDINIFNAGRNAEGAFTLGNGETLGTFKAEGKASDQTDIQFKSGTLELKRLPENDVLRRFEVKYNLIAETGDTYTGHYRGEFQSGEEID